MQKLILAAIALSLSCGGESRSSNSPGSSSEDASAEDSSSEEAPQEAPNQLAQALIRLQAPGISADKRREAMRVFVEALLQSEVYVLASGPVTDRSTLECFTDAASVSIRYPGQDARAVDARALLAHARDKGLGLVIRHESKSGSVYTGFTPADAARLLEI